MKPKRQIPLTEEEIKLECLRLADRIKSPDHNYTLKVARIYWKFICNQLEGFPAVASPETKNKSDTEVKISLPS